MNILILVLSMVVVAMGEDTKEVKQWLIEGNEQFTAKMFTEVCNEHPGQSVVFSAFSVLSPLAQLALASSGESHDEILRTIGLPNDNVTKEVFPIVNTELRANKGVELKIASRIYISKDYKLNHNFSAISRDVFNSEVKNADFTKNVESAHEINAWVEDQTNHRIKDLVNSDSLDGSTRAVLVNAIYFKGNWSNKFNPALTIDRDFHVSKEKTIKIPMMYKKGDYRYGESALLNATLLELFYEDGQSSLLVVLPNEIDGITALEEKMKDPTILSKAVEDMFEIEVQVYLPKFKIETEINIKTVLSHLGVTKLFDPSSARLDHLLENASDLYITDAIQKAFIEVNEEGAEAAAANEFGVAYLSAVISENYKFNANHPFIFQLKSAQNILFSGVYQP